MFLRVRENFATPVNKKFVENKKLVEIKKLVEDKKEVKSNDKKPKAHAPRPVLGSCVNTGQWKNVAMVDDCINCVSQPGYYGESQFYCNGKCMSEYDTAQHCSTKSLVAENVGQCSAPCFQEGAPRLSNKGGNFSCTVDSQCGDGYICAINKKAGTSKCVLATQASTTQAPTITQPPTTQDTNEIVGFPTENFENEGEYNYSQAMYSARGGFYDDKTKLFIGVL